MNDSRNVYGTERLDKWSNVTGAVIIPGWIYRAILRKKLAMAESNDPRWVKRRRECRYWCFAA